MVCHDTCVYPCMPWRDFFFLSTWLQSVSSSLVAFLSLHFSFLFLVIHFSLSFVFGFPFFIPFFLSFILISISRHSFPTFIFFLIPFSSRYFSFPFFPILSLPFRSPASAQCPVPLLSDLYLCFTQHYQSSSLSADVC